MRPAPLTRCSECGEKILRHDHPNRSMHPTCHVLRLLKEAPDTLTCKDILREVWPNRWRHDLRFASMLPAYNALRTGGIVRGGRSDSRVVYYCVSVLRRRGHEIQVQENLIRLVRRREEAS